MNQTDYQPRVKTPRAHLEPGTIATKSCPCGEEVEITRDDLGFAVIECPRCGHDVDIEFIY